MKPGYESYATFTKVFIDLYTGDLLGGDCT